MFSDHHQRIVSEIYFDARLHCFNLFSAVHSGDSCTHCSPQSNDNIATRARCDPSRLLVSSFHTQGFAASVGLGLHRFRGPQGVRELCESLSKKYTLEQRDGATQQLAMLFSLLPPGVQPVSTVRSLLSFPMAGASMFRTVKSTPVDDVDLPSTLGESPSALLPKDLRPEYDEGLKAYFIPGIPRQMEESDLALAFGGRGPFPISKVI